MAQFTFNLEHVLRARRHAEQEHQRLLADEQAVMTKLEAKLRELDGNVQANMDDLRNNRLTGSLDMRFLAAHRRFVLAVRQEAMGVVQAMARQQSKVDEAQQHLAEAAKQRKIIEKLRERAHDRWRSEQAHKEALQADEVATQLSYRKMVAEAAERDGAAAVSS
jgi:flagellar protein FliJ